MKVIAHAPGRVNLIGEHTDYTGGYVVPMAIQLGTTIEFERGVPWIELVSDVEPEPVVLDLASPVDPRLVQPAWGRYVAGVVAAINPQAGGSGFVRTTLPVGAGLSSSAALEVALALALGFEGPPLALALACQQAEQIASGVPCGVMDQLASAAGVADHALLIDCTSFSVDPVPIPDGMGVLVVDSGQQRLLSESRYGVRRAQVEDAATELGFPLREASEEEVSRIGRDDLRRRARHVVTENRRVHEFVSALRAGDLREAGRLVDESHASLREDFDVSTPLLDDLADALRRQPGVHGARLTGAGFGGCLVALCERDARVDPAIGERQWWVDASAGAQFEVLAE